MLPNIKKILYATDLSENSAHALSYAVNAAISYNTELVILHVLERINPAVENVLIGKLGDQFFLEDFRERSDVAKAGIQQRLDRVLGGMPSETVDAFRSKVDMVICEGFPPEQILSQADELDCDAIVMGTHGKGFLSQTFLGSMAKMVLRRTRKPIFIIPLPKVESELTVNMAS